MKNQSWMGLLPLLLLIVSCNSAPTPATESAPEIPSADAEIAESDLTEGIVVPGQQSTLSFLIAGSIAEVFVAEGDLVQAGESLIEIDAPELDSAVLAAEASLRIAELELVYWTWAHKNKPPERRWLAENRIVAAEKAVETALVSRKQKTLLAPFNATVVDISVMVGEVVSPHQGVILLADLENLKIETTDLNERDVVNISVGDTALVYIEALELEIEGLVVAISPIPTDNSSDVVYTTTIILKEYPASLRWGMSTKIDFDRNQ